MADNLLGPENGPTRAPPSSTGRQWPALVAALVTVVLWASAFVGIRAAVHDLSAGSLALGRMLVASLLLGVLVLVRREPLPARRDLPLIGLCGFLWFGIYGIALNEGERHLDAGTAAMLVNVGPVLITILAGLVLKEGFPPRLLVGCALAFGGTVVIGLSISQAAPTSGWGVVLCLVAAATYAGGVVAQKPVLARTSPLQVTWLACTIGALTCLPFAPELWRELGHAPRATAWILYLGAGPTAIAFVTWAFALARTSAGRMGVTTYLVPPLAVIMSSILLREVPTWLSLLGGTLSLAGVAVARRTRWSRSPSAGGPQSA